ncbi:MAG: hypothetical protein O3A55_01890 [Bacteroidetes bacterium]|nr:hypothetical protein [Bacteroidota bacterium]
MEENKFFINKNSSSIILEGKDVLTFLQRLSTNDFTNFKDVKFTTTCFLNDKGKIVDICDIYLFNDKYYLTSQSKYFGETIKYLEKYIIMDDVKIIKNELYNSDLEMFRVIENTEEELKLKNINLGQININEFTFQKYNPLELNLWKYISFGKGCYLGQEVIARLDTYQKISKQLVLLVSEENNFELSLNTDDIIDSKNNVVGKIISNVNCDKKNYYLGVVQRNGLNNDSLFTKDKIELEQVKCFNKTE